MRATMTSYLFEVAAVETHVSVEGGNVLEAAMTQLALHRLRLAAIKQRHVCRVVLEER